jgi:iron-sulfur cluster assembly enzyme ISCU, mitochondrial
MSLFAHRLVSASRGRLSVIASQFSRTYHENVHDHFYNPRNVGKLDKNDPSVGTATVGKAACGDVVQLQVKIEGGVITDAKFKTFGCGSAIASSSFATELIKGKTAAEASSLKNTDISQYLKLPPVKIHCSLLVEEAVKAALEDYEKKQAKIREVNI